MRLKAHGDTFENVEREEKKTKYICNFSKKNRQKKRREMNFELKL